jgi:hydrophobic/amphiphilic exporter-1 (mainly G- bacteria), HAE1 family
MKKISEFSVNFPITVLMLIAAVGLLGIISFNRLSVDLLPDLNNPRIFVDISAGELPPEELERKLIDNIEALIMRQQKVTSVSSILRVGRARITVEYNWETDMDEALLDLQKNLSQVTQNDEIDELSFSQHDPNSDPVMLIGLFNTDIEDMDVLRRTGSNFIRNELIRLDGVAAVDVLGGQEKEVRIETEQNILDAYNLTIDDIANRITSSNIDLTGGSIEELGIKYVIKGQGAFENLDEINNVVVAYSASNESNGNQKPVFLHDVAQVHFKNKQTLSIVKINRKRAIALAVYKETKSNTVRAVQTVRDALKDIQKALPGYSFTIISNQARFISNAINEVEQSAVYGIVLAVLVLFVFLRRMGTTFIISLAIPISIIATFNLMYFNDLSLNIMTLGGLALGAGMLVDNAIVVVESIFRNLEKGLSLKEAAVLGTSQVAGAITASTVTTIVVFLPIVYLHGAAGELFKDQAWTVAFSLIASLFVAVLIIPMLSNWILKDKSIKQGSVQFVNYGTFLENVLKHRKMVLLLTLLMLLLTAFETFNIGNEFMPKIQSDVYTLDITLPEGTNLQHTDKFVSGFEETLKENIKVDQVYTQIGDRTSISTGADDESFQDENYAFLKIDLQENNRDNAILFNKFVSTYLDSFKTIEYTLKPEESSLSVTLGTDAAAPLVLEFAGKDLDILKEIATSAMQKIQNISILKNVETSIQSGRPQINLVVDRTAAGYAGISISQITTQLQEILAGKTSGSMEYSGEIRDINVLYPQLTISSLQQSFIRNGSQKIPLSDLVRFEYSHSDRELYRRNQKRIVWISADFDDNISLSRAVEAIDKEMKTISLPPNYTYSISGAEEKRSESFDSLKFALLLSVILIYMVLASQFESLLHPFTIILTVPLAAIGAILIFFVLGMPLNVMAYIGIIMLMGIAVNDSIILVDAINYQRRQGADIIPAIISAGQQRIRPIIMTSLTTILALVPLTIGFGESAALRAPMAIAVIGGLVSSTVLTLIVIPCVYYYFERMRRL